MLIRLASVLISVGLFGSAASAETGSFARAPVAQVEEARMPVRMPPSRAEVRRALEKRRATNLAAFRAYRKAGIYPHNTVRPGPLNVWRDVDGNLCAAATMIAKDGHLELVTKTAESNNFIRLLNVVDGPLLDWMMTSGFTIEEIDRIQMPGDFIDNRPDTREEDARLARGYAATDTHLVKTAKRGLDLATDRLMKNPQLARQLVDSTL